MSEELAALYADYERLAVLWHRMWCDHDVFPDGACPLNRRAAREARAVLAQERE